jgi:putative FmdB family regulatory protein
MPIYEYECADCSSSFEELVAASAADSVRCPTCSGADVTRKLSQFAAGRTAAVGGGGGGGCCGGGCGCG